MTPAAPRAVAPERTDRHWALFADWCTATDQRPLPASPDTLLAFLAELPAGPATTRRRLRDIDVAHRIAGLPPPSAAPAFDALLRPERPPRFDPALVAAALEMIPVVDWPAGFVGRRDAALVVLVCVAGLTRAQIRTLRHTLGQGQLDEAALPALPTTPRPDDCPACALSRWLRVHLTLTAEGWRVVRNQLADLAETSADEGVHDCTQPLATSAALEQDTAPLFPPITRHGNPETWALSTRSVTTIVATRLAAPATVGSHDRWGDAQPAVAGPGRARGLDDRARGLAARRAAADRLAEIEASLDEADAYAEAILQRVEADLAGRSAW